MFEGFVYCINIKKEGVTREEDRKQREKGEKGGEREGERVILRSGVIYSFRRRMTMEALEYIYFPVCVHRYSLLLTRGTKWLLSYSSVEASKYE